MKIVKHLAPNFIKRRYLGMQQRLDKLEGSVRNLEAVIDALVVQPSYLSGEDVGFNGQRCRKHIFGDIISAISPDAIVETGTWLGNTTGYMAQTAKRPVYSGELNPRFHAVAKKRLADIKNVRLILKDSRAFLHELAQGELSGKCLFFYLDAHWYEDLPLGEEIDLIASAWRRFVVMIDDFKVPDDDGYAFDDYGNGKTLGLELLGPAMAMHSLAAYFPAARSQEETGARRGCVVLAAQGDLTEKLSVLTSLRQWRGPA